jgi:MFS family permease
VEPNPEAASLRDRQRRAFGGSIQWEAAFFGWLAAIGLAALLVAMAVGAEIAVGLRDFDDDPGDRARELGLGGSIVLMLILALAYCAGGYVAARMARFDGWRQGLGVWLVALTMTVALALFAWALGGDVNPLESLELPRIPVQEEGSFPLASVIVTGAIAIVTLLAALGGGVAGERFHRVIDAARFELQGVMSNQAIGLDVAKAIQPPPQHQEPGTPTEPEPAAETQNGEEP